jgi:hypothetical protein
MPCEPQMKIEGQVIALDDGPRYASRLTPVLPAANAAYTPMSRAFQRQRLQLAPRPQAQHSQRHALATD